jgi:hypothetical protein
MRELLTFLKHKERDRFGKVSRRGQAKRKGKKQKNALFLKGESAPFC